MKPFKFFQKPNKIQDNWMDGMDDYILGRITPINNEIVEVTNIMQESINSIRELNNYLNDNLGSRIVTNSEVSGDIE
jgi:CRISPR/Cas system-associated protein Cas7 (RAMP superfamily)